MGKLSFGCDPEFFSVVKVGEEDFVISPALMEIYSGLKYIHQDTFGKHPVYIEEKDYLWMMDGAAWEITIRKPHENPAELYRVLQSALTHLEEFLSGYKFEGLDLSLYKKPVVNIDPDQYMKLIEHEKIYQGFIFGCDPDRDAFRPDYVCDTIDVTTHKFRYGGGHIHVSGSDSLRENYLNAVKLMAITAGNFCIANSPHPELEKQRATTYGRPGRYRPQKYKGGIFGVEYRTPSNSWTNFSLSQVEELYHWVAKAVEYTEKERDDVINNFADETVNAIINADGEISAKILKELV